MKIPAIFRKLNDSQRVTLALQTETDFIALTMTVLACMLGSLGMMIFAFICAALLRDSIVFDRRPEMRTASYCVGFLFADAFLACPLFLLSPWAVLVCALAVCILACLRAAAITYDLMPRFLHRIRPVDVKNAIRVSNHILLHALARGILCFAFGVLSVLVCGSWGFSAVFAVPAAVSLAFFGHNWSRAAMVEGEKLIVLGPQKGEYDLRNLTIQKRKRPGSLVFISPDGKNLFRMTALCENAFYTEGLLEKKKLIP